MKKYTKNNKGLSLIEVMAALVILSLASLLLMGILSSSTTTHIKQVSSSKQLYDTTYTLKLITKDIRRTSEFNSPSLNNYLFSHNSSVKFSYSYDTKEGILYRAEEGEALTPIAKNVVKFEIKSNPENTAGLTIQLEIIDSNGQIQTGSTQVYFRK